ncbi:MAG: BphX family protein [Chloroflexi bacterium]|nr:BphX family protein [Chloroflexota bacterium]
MKKLQWWFRIVGAFYLLLTLMNLGVTIFDTQLQMYKDLLPPPLTGNTLAARGFADAWFVFVMDVLGTAIFLLWASRNPLKHISVVWFAVLLEFLHGVVGDAYWITRGYDVMSYLVFIVIHFIIIVTGAMFAREASAQTA